MSNWKHEFKQVDVDIELVVDAIRNNGKKQNDGTYTLPFGQLLKLKNVPYDAFARLKAGKAKGIFDYKGQFLMQGAHDNVPVVLKIPDWKAPK